LRTHSWGCFQEKEEPKLLLLGSVLAFGTVVGVQVVVVVVVLLLLRLSSVAAPCHAVVS